MRHSAGCGVVISMTPTILRVLLCLFLAVTKSNGSEAITADYGVDISFPMHQYIQDKDSVFHQRYMKSMEGCYKAYSKVSCDATEHARMQMNLDQPRSQHNYTEQGFKKTRVPDDLFKEITQFYQENIQRGKYEEWPPGNTYVNSWVSRPQMISFDDRSLRGASDLKQRIWDGVKPIISEWVGKELKDTSLYGIRVYPEGSILATHVDRLPLVSSCIIQVAQDIDEPWPVEVISHTGVAYNISMVPGDMVLYESHSVLHGRPFPLVGRYYANIFVHFIPVDHEVMNEKDMLAAEALNAPSVTDRLKSVFGGLTAPKKMIVGGHEQDNHDENEIQKFRTAIEAKGALEEQEEEEGVAEEGEEGEEEEGEEQDAETIQQQRAVDGMTALHVAARHGDLAFVIALLQSFESGSVSGTANYDMVHARDINDWQAIHEAASAGHLEVLKYLVDKGSDINAVTKKGGTVLWWAKRLLYAGDPVIAYLEEIGAKENTA